MQKVIDMLTSSTNWVIFVMVTFLCFFNTYALIYYPSTIFEKVFVVFTNVLSGYAGYQYGYGKSKPSDASSGPTNSAPTV